MEVRPWPSRAASRDLSKAVPFVLGGLSVDPPTLKVTRGTSAAVIEPSAAPKRQRKVFSALSPGSQHTDLKFPILAAADLSMARMVDLIHPEQSETAAVRPGFIIDPAKNIRQTTEPGKGDQDVRKH